MSVVSPYSHLFPEDVVVVSARPEDADLSALFPKETAQIERAVPKRKLEYAAARGLARRALASLGAAQGPIVNDADRVPSFPAGVVGGITHTRGLCVVVAARQASYHALGVDAEGAAPLEEKLWETVLRPEERARLSALDPALRGAHAKLVFCVKECAYKAQYPLSRRYFGFSGMSVEAQDGRFVATMEIDAAPFSRGHRLEGRYSVDASYVVAGLALPR